MFLVFHLSSHEPLPQDLELRLPDDAAHELAVLEVSLAHPLLRFGAHLVVAPCEPNHGTMSVQAVFEKCLDNATPIIIYSFSKPVLSARVRCSLLSPLPSVLMELQGDVTEWKFEFQGICLSFHPCDCADNEKYVRMHFLFNCGFEVMGEKDYKKERKIIYYSSSSFFLYS